MRFGYQHSCSSLVLVARFGRIVAGHLGRSTAHLVVVADHLSMGSPLRSQRQGQRTLENQYKCHCSARLTRSSSVIAAFGAAQFSKWSPADCHLTFGRWARHPG